MKDDASANEDVPAGLRPVSKDEFAVALMEQEHRWLPVIQNAIEAYREHPAGDPRRRAALRALLWRLFGPATVVTAGIGITSLAGLLLALVTALLLAQQNDKLDQQTHLAEASRASALTSELGLVIGLVYAEASKVCLDNGGRRQCWAAMDFEERRAGVARFAAAFPTGGAASGAGSTSELKSWSGGVEATRPVLMLSNETSGRIRALTTALRPYRFVLVTSAPTLEPQGWVEQLRSLFRGKDEPTLSAKPLSREKGVLLRELVELSARSSAGGDFRRTLLRGMSFPADLMTAMNLEDSDLDCSTIQGAKYASFRGSSLRFSDFRGADLREANFDNARLTGSSLLEARLPPADKFHPADLSDVWLEGARVDSADWLDRLRDPQGRPVPGLTTAGLPRWKVRPATLVDASTPPFELVAAQANLAMRDSSGDCVVLRSE